MTGKPEPTYLKLVKGNPGKRALNKREPRPVGRLKEPPAHLSETEAAGWRYVIDHAPPGMLKRLDRGALVVWVVAEDLHRRASQEINRSSLLVKSSDKGVPIQNPYLPILNRQALIMLKAASELGFTPAARPRIEVDSREFVKPEEAEEDDISEFL